MDEAYQNRSVKMAFLIENKLGVQKEGLRKRILELGYVRDSVRHEKDAIEDDTRDAFSGILGRLEQAANPKIARLAAEIESLEGLLKQIEVVLHDAEFCLKSSPVILMTRLQVFKENINYLLMKNFDKEINEDPYDLPRELYDLRNTLESMENEDMLVKFKNHIIVEIALQNQKAKKDSLGILNTQGEQEVSAWMDLADQLSKKVAQFYMVCHFCAEPFSEIIVNGNCYLNRPENVYNLNQFKGFSNEKPDAECLGTLFHFFAKPDAETFKDTRLMQLLISQKEKQGVNPYRQAMILELESTLNQIRRKLDNNPSVEVDEVLQSHDKFSVGILNKITLVYALNSAYGITEPELLPLLAALDPYRNDLISIQEFIDVVRNPLAVDQLPFFTYASQPTAESYAQYRSKFEVFVQKEKEQHRKETQAEEKMRLLTEKHYQQLLKEKELRDKKEKERLNPGAKQSGTGSRTPAPRR